uniref:BPTI/Kunitz inhibitor domain-containing protein n=1 Tax=Pseudonaja textilis TaxID=8673 RepID=A0A670YKM6_PSETE
MNFLAVFGVGLPSYFLHLCCPPLFVRGTACLNFFFSLSVHLPEKCTLRPRIGSCTTLAFCIFFLDTVTGTCMMFVYSGCEGNEDNFFTSDECQKECKRKIRNFWNLSSILVIGKTGTHYWDQSVNI